MRSQQRSNDVICPKCGSSEASRHERAEAGACPECGHRWADTTASERAFRLAAEADTATITGVGTVEVKYMAVGGEEIGVRCEDGSMLRVLRSGDGNVNVESVPENKTVAESAVIALADDPWA